MSEVCVETAAEIGHDGGDGKVATTTSTGSGDHGGGASGGALPKVTCTVSVAETTCDDTSHANIIINPPADEVADMVASSDLKSRPNSNSKEEPITSDMSDRKPISTPTLRVERVKDEVSEDEVGSASEGHGLSQAEVSDQDLSGKENKNGDDFPIPDDELINKVNTQVEFYFSDVNILKDAFLLKHVRRNKQGFVSIKLITSFKKVKSLSRDFRAVAYCLRKSSKLQVNDEGTKVRRVDPLPDFDETTPSRTVVAVNLPLEHPTIESIAELFKECGEIALIRILRPGKTIPGDIKKYSNKHPEIGTSVCGVVEFENHESALKACNLSKAEDWRDGLRVVILSSKKKDKGTKGEKTKEKQNAASKERDQSKKDSTKEKVSNEPKEVNDTKEGVKHVSVKTPEADEVEADVSGVGDKDVKGKTSPKPQASPVIDKKVPAVTETGSGKKKSKNKKKQTLGGEGAGSGSEMDQTNSPSDRDMNWRSSLSPGRCIDKSKLSPASTPGSSPRNSPRSSPRSKRRTAPNKSSPLAVAEGLSPRQSPKPSPMSSPESLRRNRESPAGDAGVSPSGSPWVQRRLKAAQELSPLAADGSPMSSPLLGRKGGGEGVVRQPKGPDGTKGFYGGLGRGKLQEPTEAH